MYCILPNTQYPISVDRNVAEIVIDRLWTTRLRDCRLLNIYYLHCKHLLPLWADRDVIDVDAG
jgi:hypothetical protein